MSRTLTVHELSSLLEQTPDAVTVLDVRRRADRDADPQRLPQATWRDPEQVQTWMNELPAKGDVVIYCVRGGSVSNSVLDALLAKQHHARYLEGGITAWKQAGGSVTDL